MAGGDGALAAARFFQNQKRSEQGVKNQGWKDSSDEIVYADGSQIEDPIATCEAQWYYYAAKEQLGQVLWALGRHEEAAQFRAPADEFRKRFNDACWMEDENLYALGLDGNGNQITSAASNAAHCLGAGIVDPERAVKIGARLMQDDVLSGWNADAIGAPSCL